MSAKSDAIGACIKDLDGIMTSIAYAQDDKLQFYIESLRENMIGHPNYQRTIRYLLNACVTFTKEAAEISAEFDLS